MCVLELVILNDIFIKFTKQWYVIICISGFV